MGNFKVRRLCSKWIFKEKCPSKHKKGGSKRWTLTVSFGGKEKRLSTNTYSNGIPGSKNGPVVIDFATSIIAGGWVYSAKRLGLKLQKGSIIDKYGNPTDDPEDYFSGGAILPAGGTKAYSLSVIAEFIAEAMLDPVTLHCNWLIITVDTNIFQNETRLKTIAEEVWSDIRSCPPVTGFERLEIPAKENEKLQNYYLLRVLKSPVNCGHR